MAESLGRPLLRTEHVHHKNEDTMDDKRKNLKIMLQGKHNTCHHLGKHITPETRKKMSLAQKGNSNHKGKYHTEETKHRMSLAHKGMIFTAEHKHNISFAKMGKHHTVETRKKISLSRKSLGI